MTPVEHVLALAAMALAIVTILVVGTLAAADLLPLGRRKAAAQVRSRERETRRR